MKRAAAIAVVIWVAWACPARGASPQGAVRVAGDLFRRPMEVATQQADLVMVGQVASVGRARKISLTPRGASKPVTRLYSSCRVRVVRVIKSPGSSTGGTVSAGGTIEVEALAVPRDGVPRGPEGTRCVLAAGGRHVLLVHRLPETNGWVVPFGSDHYLKATDAVILAAARAVRVAAWPWGPPKGGLQMAVISKWTRWRHMIRGRPTIFFRTYVALRNTSRRPVTVNLRPGDTPLTIEARKADGTVVTGDLYRSLAWRLKGQWPRSAETIRPGEVIFVGQTGRKAVQIEASLDVPAGPWTVHVGYRNTRQATEENKPLWTGRIAAKPLVIEVVPRGAK